MISRLGENELGQLHWIEDLQSPTFQWDWSQLFELKDSHEFWGLIQNQQVVACVAIIRLPQAWEIPLLATHPSHQKRGHMRLLLKTVLDAKQQDAEVWLEVHEGNQAARALYAQLGFAEVGRRPRYYSDGATALLLTRK